MAELLLKYQSRRNARSDIAYIQAGQIVELYIFVRDTNPSIYCAKVIAVTSVGERVLVNFSQGTDVHEITDAVREQVLARAQKFRDKLAGIMATRDNGIIVISWLIKNPNSYDVLPASA